ERAKARHFVENFRDEVVKFLRVQSETLNQHILGNELLDMTPKLFFRHFVQGGKIDLLDQPAVQPHLRVEQPVAEQGAFGLLFGLRRLCRSFRGYCPGHAFERRWRRLFRRRNFWRRRTPGCETTDHLSRPPSRALISSSAAPTGRRASWM